MHSDENLYCRVCGFRNDEPPWGADGKTPLYEHCPCCGVESGYQDATPVGAKRYREQWLDKGATWDEPNMQPEGWSVEEQLEHVPAEFR